MAMSKKIIDLRNLLAVRFPQPPMPVGTRLATVLLPLINLLAAACPKGRSPNQSVQAKAREVHRSFMPSSMAHLAINISSR